MKKFLIFITFSILVFYCSCDYQGWTNQQKFCINQKKYLIDEHQKGKGRYGYVVINDNPYKDQVLFVIYEKKNKVVKIKDNISLITEETSHSYQFEKWINLKGLNNFLKKTTFQVNEKSRSRITSFLFKLNTKIEIIDKVKK